MHLYLPFSLLSKEIIASNGGIKPLVDLLDSELEDVLVNTVNAIRVLCINNPANQSEVGASGALQPLVEFLTITSGEATQIMLFKFLFRQCVCVVCRRLENR